MLDIESATLSANIIVLVAAVSELTAAIKEHISVCKQELAAPDPIAAFSNLTLTPPSAPAPPPALPPALAPAPAATPPALNVPVSTGNSPTILRAQLAARNGSTQGPWYIVTVGQEPGLYQHTGEVALMTNGVPGNSHKKYASQDAALEVYEQAWNIGAVRRVR